MIKQGCERVPRDEVDGYFTHESAVIDKPCSIGRGSKIWHFTHVNSGAQIGERCVLGQNVYIAGSVVMGDNVKIQNNVSVYDGTSIEDDVFLGPSCVLTNVSNPRSQVNRHAIYERTKLCRGCTIGANATIVAGVTIGRYAFIAAGAVVVSDVPDYALMMGVPARQVGWMSRHGHRLKETAAGDLICAEVGYRYREVAPGMLRCLDLNEDDPLPVDITVGTQSYDYFKSSAKPTRLSMNLGVRQDHNMPVDSDSIQSPAPNVGPGSVPLLDLNRQNEPLFKELIAGFSSVIKSGQYILGREVEGFERECADYLGVRHALAVSSGTDAMLLALMTLGIGAGDEVICPTYSFFATGGSIWRTGARPVFVDIDAATYNVDAKKIRAAVTSRTRAIMPVHLFGQCASMDVVQEIAKEHNLAVIEDAAQAFGAKYGNRAAGTIGDLGCFSFFPSKNLSGFGDGGLISTNDENLHKRARILRTHGGQPKYHHKFVGGNFRMDALQAALLRVKLPHLEEYTSRRQANAELYTKLFMSYGLSQSTTIGSTNTDAPLVLPQVTARQHIFNQYVIRVTDNENGQPRRDALRKALSAVGIGTEVYYPVPLHLQECFAGLGGRPGDAPVAELASGQTIALPIFPELRLEEIRRVVDCVQNYFSAGHSV